MRKVAVWVVLMSMGAGSAFARAIEGPDAARYLHRQEVAAARKARGPHIVSPAEEKRAAFWKNEGERSGMSHWSSGASNILHSLNPVPFLKEQDRRYKERKARAASAK